MPVRTKRIYVAPSHDDGYRVLSGMSQTRGPAGKGLRAIESEWLHDVGGCQRAPG
jgi:uncharacterized protein YeaO (DUF488 family)